MKRHIDKIFHPTLTGERRQLSVKYLQHRLTLGLIAGLVVAVLLLTFPNNQTADVVVYGLVGSLVLYGFYRVLSGKNYWNLWLQERKSIKQDREQDAAELAKFIAQQKVKK